VSVRRRTSGRAHYNYFRDYDPAIGKYDQSDPIGLRGGLNTYLYAEANPLRRTDPEGLLSVEPEVIELALERAGYAEIIGGGPEDPAADIAAAIVIIGTIVISTSDPDSAKGHSPRNPGRDCNGKCKPCPPNQYWGHPGNDHGSTSGVHYHGLIWNQRKDTCECYPKRVSGPSLDKLK
jgi:RHS repeat-associated protein